jgi:hypothetical protein
LFFIPNGKQRSIDSKLGCLLRSRGHPFFTLKIWINEIPRTLRKAGNLVHRAQQIPTS